MAEETKIEEAGLQQQHFSCTDLKELKVLALFPLWLQDVIINAIMGSDCERATDIWCEDEATGTVHVMRSNMQWHLNTTASQLWVNLEENKEKKVGDIIHKMCEEYQDTDKKEIYLYCIEFLLLAFQNGLVTFPNESSEVVWGVT